MSFPGSPMGPTASPRPKRGVPSTRRLRPSRSPTTVPRSILWDDARSLGVDVLHRFCQLSHHLGPGVADGGLWVSGRNCAKTSGSSGCALFFQTVTSQPSLQRGLLSTARYEATCMMAMHPNFPHKSV